MIWPSVRVEEIAADGRSAIAIGPFGSRMKSDCYSAVGVPVIRGTNISQGRGFVGDFVFIPDELADTMLACNVYAGDLVFPHRGAIGEVGIVPDDGKRRYMLSTSLMKLSVDLSRVEPLYVYYFFKSRLGRHELLKNASQVGTPGIATPLTSLKGIELPLPPLDEQRAIASVLGSLDDKIELNRRMNRTLEQMAAAIFKEWFVDFEPVRAKASGAASFPGMPQPVFDALPATFANSELGPIPEGWELKRMDEIAEAKKGLSYKGAGLIKDPKDFGEGLPMHNLNSVLEGGGYKYSGIKYYRGEFKERHVLSPGDIVVTNTEQGFEYRLIGFPAIVPKCHGSRGLFTHHLFRVRVLDGECVSQLFLYHAMMSSRLREDIVGYTNGTTVNMLAVEGLQRPYVAVPPQVVAVSFEKIVDPLHALIETNHEESAVLAETRNALLPKLLSGEVRVCEAEGVIA